MKVQRYQQTSKPLVFFTQFNPSDLGNWLNVLGENGWWLGWAKENQGQADLS